MPDTIKLFYDVETTGTNYMKHSVIDLAGIIEVNDSIAETFEFQVKPHPKAKIEPEALSVNKTTVEEIMQYPNMMDVYKELTKILDNYVDKFDTTQKIFLVGFRNASFDDFFLRMFFELCGDKYFNSYFHSGSIDVSCLAAEYLQHRIHHMKSFKLKRVALELGLALQTDKLHSSLYDSTITRSIYRIVTGREQEPDL